MATNPEDLQSAAELVNSTFALAKDYADAAEAKLATFTQALETSIYAPPTLSVTWQTLPPPTLEQAPAAPAMPNIAYNPANVGGTPAPLAEAIPDIDIPEFTDTLPPLVFPAAPAINYGVVPTVPAVGNVPVPAAPSVSMPGAPTFLELKTVAFSGVNLREDWLDKLQDAPQLEILAPTPYSYKRGPEYASQLLDNLKAVLNRRIAGGSGLAPAVEQALWARARDREATIARSGETEVLRLHAARGFVLPSGVMAEQLRQANRDYLGKLSDLSRDISIKQAELEQQNLREAIAQGMQLEAQLMDYSWKIEQQTFEAARLMAENAIAVHNAQLEQFKALLQGYESYASVYKTIIESQLAKVEVYKAQLAAEQSKADINRSLVERYKVQIEAGMAEVEIYRAQVAAAQTLVQLEQAKIGAAGEQVRAYVAQMNAETAKMEIYKSGVQAEATKVEVFKARGAVYSTQVQAQAEKSRALVSRFQALAQAKSSEWEGYRARVAAEGLRLDALGKQSAAMLDAYRVANAAIQSKAELQTKVWETSMRQYEAGIQVSLQTARMNNEAVIAANNARADAAKVGTQVFAQLTASAMNMMHTSAGISGSASRNESHSYSYEGTS